MSLARATPFCAQSGMLLRYGQLRQQADAMRTDMVARGMASVPQLLVPGVLPALLASLPDATGPDVVTQQRSSAWLNQLCWELTSGTFVRVLEAMSGLAHLLPDPYFRCGGLLRDMPAALPAQHPEWRLPPVLVLDLVLRGRVAPEATDGRLWEPGSALLWLAAAPAPIRAVGPDALVWRHVFFHGPEPAA